MFYIDSQMTGAPLVNFASGRNIIDIFKDVLKALESEQQSIIYNSINNNIVTINNGFNFKEDFAIYEISDGINTVYSKLKIIDSNNFLIIEDISNLNSQNITIRVPRLNIKIEQTDTEERFLFDREMVLIFKKSSADVFDISNNAQVKSIDQITSSSSISSKGIGFYFLYNDHFVFFNCENSYSQSNNTCFFISAGENGFLEFFNGPTRGASLYSGFNSMNMNYEVSENPVNISQTGRFFGVANYLSDQGYLFERILQVSGKPPEHSSLWPYLLDNKIVLANFANSKTLGFLYE